jgi:hypothetical protein
MIASEQTIQLRELSAQHNEATHTAEEHLRILSQLRSPDQATLGKQTAAGSRREFVDSLIAATDASIAEARLLWEQLWLRSQLKEQTSHAEVRRVNLEPVEQFADSPASDELDAAARSFLASGTRRIALFLEWQSAAFAEHDIDTARTLGSQTLRLSSALVEVQDAWPWIDYQAEHKSWRQYVQGELVDFETFKHELLEAAQ